MCHTSAGRGVKGTDLAGYVPSSEYTSSLRRPSLQALNLLGGVRFIAWRPNDARCIFGNARRVWAMALRSDPPKKRPCAILIRLVGWKTNTETSAGCDVNSTYLVGCISSLDIPRASGGRRSRL